MKKVIIIFFCCFVCGYAAIAQDSKQPTNAQPVQVSDPDAGVFNFTEETHDFGEIPEGPFAECDFVYKNTGKKPIIISNAYGSCGCTVPEWSHEPIVPGSSSTIHVKYTTAGHQGPINKDVTVVSNAQQARLVLHIKGNVAPKPVEAIMPVNAITGK